MIKKFETVHVNSLPIRSEMEENQIYISEKTWQSSHLCACGCGEEVLTPLLRGGWHYYTNEENDVTLSPSITNQVCDSTYSINQGYAILNS